LARLGLHRLWVTALIYLFACAVLLGAAELSMRTLFGGALILAKAVWAALPPGPQNHASHKP
jgi:hypothetical protein